jgi:hypothetical protein
VYLGKNAIIVKKVMPNDDVIAEFSPYFESVAALDEVPAVRHGNEAMRIGVYRARNFRKLFPTTQPR